MPPERPTLLSVGHWETVPLGFWFGETAPGVTTLYETGEPVGVPTLIRDCRGSNLPLLGGCRTAVTDLRTAQPLRAWDGFDTEADILKKGQGTVQGQNRRAKIEDLSAG